MNKIKYLITLSFLLCTLSQAVNAPTNVFVVETDATTNPNVSSEFLIYKSIDLKTWDLFINAGNSTSVTFTNPIVPMMFFKGKKVITFHNNATYNLLLSWDSSSSTNIDGYRLYYGLSSRNYDVSISLGKVNSISVPLQVDTNYFIAITSYNSQEESEYSEEIQQIVRNGDIITNDQNITIKMGN
jgi:hypothetical protein